jgi:Mrp family chromosome partitioning ATPase
LSAADKLRRDALQRRLNILALDYERLALRTLGVTSGGRLEPVILSDLSQEPASPARNGVIGLLGGFGLALASVAFVARARGEYWLSEDLPVPVLAEVPSRKSSTLPGPPWYDTTSGGHRKESIQALRNALEGAVDSDRAALAIVADKVDGPTTHALTIDLATAFASAGRSVLVVDADYEEPATSSEFSVGEPTLETVLSLPLASAEALTDLVAELLDRAVHIRPDLAVIPAGSSPDSPADSVAGSQFRSFMEVAGERFDLVVVVAGSSKSPAAQVVAQRVGIAVITAIPGRSTSSGVGALVTDLVQQRVDVIGAVGIYGRERKLAISSRPGPRGLILRAEYLRGLR